MPDFKKGQLVAVGAGLDWELRIYQRRDESGLWCMNPANGGVSPYGEESVWPAENAFPEIFLRCYRDIIEKLNRRIRWLCSYLDVSDLCPPNGPCPGKAADCRLCWEQASLKAVKDVRGNEQE